MLGARESFAKHLLKWFKKHRRDLPWRRPMLADTTVALDPYHVLVSETMLQQTQVATVIPYFNRFIEKFATIRALALADEREVLRLWQGLGYYSRARNLHAAAKKICALHGGKVPQNIDDLLDLPGVGRYTAGAIASIAFEISAPILDGNVARVLCRLDAITQDPREPETREKLWQRAEEILPQKDLGDFNSGLMELGATVCTPRNPDCSQCPVRNFCRGFAQGIQAQIPPPRKAKPTPLVHRRVLCIQDRHRWLIEQRPLKGRWAGMWQFVTVPREGAKLQKNPQRLGIIRHALTHRRYRFEVFACSAGTSAPPTRSPRAWVTLEKLAEYPLPRPHVIIAQMLARAQATPKAARTSGRR